MGTCHSNTTVSYRCIESMTSGQDSREIVHGVLHNVGCFATLMEKDKIHFEYKEQYNDNTQSERPCVIMTSVLVCNHEFEYSRTRTTQDKEFQGKTPVHEIKPKKTNLLNMELVKIVVFETHARKYWFLTQEREPLFVFHTDGSKIETDKERLKVNMPVINFL